MNILTQTCLEKLPKGTFIRFEKIKDMDKKERNAVVWRWRDGQQTDARLSHFDAVSGEYLGDTL